MSRRKVLGERYRIGEVIGSGAFSTVYYCEDLCTKELHAVKVINKHKLNDSGMNDAFEREIACMKAIQSPFVTNFVEILASGRNYYLIMELADGGTLLTITARNGGLPGHIARKYFKQLIEGLADIHAAGVVHRDIKPENLLLDGYRDLRIADFGLAAFADDNRVLKRQCGSPHYVAPEVLSGKGYNGRQADVWSMGISLFVMAYGVLPFVAPTTDKLYEKITSGKFTFPQRSLGSQKVAETLQHLITVCLRVDPKKRWTLEKISRHPWVKGRDTFPKQAAGSPSSQFPFMGPSPTTTHTSLPFTPSTNNAGMFPNAPPPSQQQQTAGGVTSDSDQAPPALPFGVSPTTAFEGNLGNFSFSELDGSYKDPSSISAAEAADLYWDSIAVATSSCPSILYKREKLSGAPGGVLSDDESQPFDGVKSAKFSLRKKRSSHYGSQSGYGGSHHSYAEIGQTPRTQSHGSKSTTPHLGSNSSNAREATPQQAAAAPKAQGPLWKRLEKDHLICLLHIQLVFFIVLIVGLMRLLFDVNIVNWPLPPPLRRLLEQAMTPPELTRKGPAAAATNASPPSSTSRPLRATPQDGIAQPTPRGPAALTLDDMNFDDREPIGRPKHAMGGGRLSRRTTENEDYFAETPRGSSGRRTLKRIGSQSAYANPTSSIVGSPRGFAVTKISSRRGSVVADFGAQSATTVGAPVHTKVLPPPAGAILSSTTDKVASNPNRKQGVGGSAGGVSTSSSRKASSKSSGSAATRRQIDDDEIKNTKTLEAGQSLMYQKDDWLKKDKNVKFADDLPSSMDSATSSHQRQKLPVRSQQQNLSGIAPTESLTFDPISTKDDDDDATTTPLVLAHPKSEESMGSSGHTPHNSSLSTSIVRALNMKKVSSVGGDLDSYNDDDDGNRGEKSSPTAPAACGKADEEDQLQNDEHLDLSSSVHRPPKRTNTAEGGLRRRRPIQNLDTSTPEAY